MILRIDSAELIAQLTESIDLGLQRDSWIPTTIGNKPLDTADLLPDFRHRFAVERARNIVAGLCNEQELADEDTAVAA